MKYKLIIDPAAKLDMVETIRWYNEQKSGLGRLFYNNIKQTLKLLKSDPQIFQIRYKIIRIAPLKKFPFIVLYHINEDKKIIAVAAVLHSSRNPDIWEQRTIK